MLVQNGGDEWPCEFATSAGRIIGLHVRVERKGSIFRVRTTFDVAAEELIIIPETAVESVSDADICSSIPMWGNVDQHERCVQLVIVRAILWQQEGMDFDTIPLPPPPLLY
jgi:hypothetical protein